MSKQQNRFVIRVQLEKNRSGEESTLTKEIIIGGAPLFAFVCLLSILSVGLFCFFYLKM